ncbi:mitotic apparatus protein p62 [Magallana gigas]|uniref:Uncharacterized protein n=5 Tax=Magallana gigas TaxID=29159 RepID=A0A8W8KMW2_MAGGI|nr:mitotic apparatus protein p62 [Crassostrea gigas]
MKIWLSLLLVLAVVSALEARRGGRRKEWRRQKFAGMQAGIHGPPDVADDDVKDDEDAPTQQNEWLTKKQRKWAMKRQRKMKWMNKRRGMMSPENSVEDKPEDTEISQDEVKPVVTHRRWQPRRGNKVDRRQKWRKMKRRKMWHHKNHGNRPSCFCLQTEQLEKLQELIKKEGLETEFPQIMPPEEDPAVDNTSDIPEEEEDDDMMEETEDFDDADEDLTDDDVENNSGESEEVTSLPMMTTETSYIIQ